MGVLQIHAAVKYTAQSYTYSNYGCAVAISRNIWSIYSPYYKMSLYYGPVSYTVFLKLYAALLFKVENSLNFCLKK